MVKNCEVSTAAVDPMDGYGLPWITSISTSMHSTGAPLIHVWWSSAGSEWGYVRAVIQWTTNVLALLYLFSTGLITKTSYDFLLDCLKFDDTSIVSSRLTGHRYEAVW